MMHVKRRDVFGVPTTGKDGLRVEWRQNEDDPDNPILSLVVVEKRCDETVAEHMVIASSDTGEHHGKLQRLAAMLTAMCDYFNANGDWEEFDRISINFYRFLPKVEIPVSTDPLAFVAMRQHVAYYPINDDVILHVIDGSTSDICTPEEFLEDLEDPFAGVA